MAFKPAVVKATGFRVVELLPSIETLPELTLIVSAYEDLFPEEQEQVKALLLQMPNCEDTEAERLLSVLSGEMGNRINLLYLAKEGEEIVGMFSASLRNIFTSVNLKEQGVGVISLANEITREDKRQKKVMTRLLNASLGRVDEDIRKKFELEVEKQGEKFLTEEDKEDGVTTAMIREQLTHPGLVDSAVKNTGTYPDKHGVEQMRVGEEFRRVLAKAAIEGGWQYDTPITHQMAENFASGDLVLVGEGDEAMFMFITQYDKNMDYPLELADGQVVHLPARKSQHIEYKYKTEGKKSEDEYNFCVSALQDLNLPLKYETRGYKAAFVTTKGEFEPIHVMEGAVLSHPDEFRKDDSEPPQIRVHFQKLTNPVEEIILEPTQ